jgi:hypothetical protein
MNRKSVSSSNLASIGYETTTLTLEIEFHNGAVYQYYNVPPELFEGLLNATSHGRYFDAHIKKGGYSFRRVS